MTLLATCYARFSSQEQSSGNSLERQFKLTTEFATSRNWDVSPDRCISDEGRSAFDGTNRAEGSALFRFEQQAEQGLYRNGHALVVEHLDRVSRQGFQEVYDFLNKLTSRGVSSMPKVHRQRSRCLCRLRTAVIWKPLQGEIDLRKVPRFGSKLPCLGHRCTRIKCLQIFRFESSVKPHADPFRHLRRDRIPNCMISQTVLPFSVEFRARTRRCPIDRETLNLLNLPRGEAPHSSVRIPNVIPTPIGASMPRALRVDAVRKVLY